MPLYNSCLNILKIDSFQFGNEYITRITTLNERDTIWSVRSSDQLTSCRCVITIEKKTSKKSCLKDKTNVTDPVNRHKLDNYPKRKSVQRLLPRCEVGATLTTEEKSVQHLLLTSEVGATFTQQTRHFNVRSNE